MSTLAYQTLPWPGRAVACYPLHYSGYPLGRAYLFLLGVLVWVPVTWVLPAVEAAVELALWAWSECGSVEGAVGGRSEPFLLSSGSGDEADASELFPADGAPPLSYLS